MPRKVKKNNARQGEKSSKAEQSSADPPAAQRGRASLKFGQVSESLFRTDVMMEQNNGKIEMAANYGPCSQTGGEERAAPGDNDGTQTP